MRNSVPFAINSNPGSVRDTIVTSIKFTLPSGKNSAPSSATLGSASNAGGETLRRVLPLCIDASFDLEDSDLIASNDRAVKVRTPTSQIAITPRSFDDILQDFNFAGS
mmetsp:Transcript_14329/g.31174  ORF Transcript_14329/g.31174 Transcript_14329/m.31174 type:complete len:108 (+) Transcript_14329:525-848(+)